MKINLVFEVTSESGLKRRPRAYTMPAMLFGRYATQLELLSLVKKLVDFAKIRLNLNLID